MKLSKDDIKRLRILAENRYKKELSQIYQKARAQILEDILDLYALLNDCKEFIERRDKPKLIGKSLTFCVRDIIDGRVDIRDVEYIIAGTAFETWDDWKDAIDEYCLSYWLSNPGVARRVVNNLIMTDRIIQPRLFGENPPDDISSGNWEVKNEFFE